ncbi:exopolyphosphatase PRUNE1 [Rhea pennata]|uniref:exopolyphosphatase PRUNE1 n=1 Tax=Rhea pennata TaxID=8795 RepID=UPI002E266DAA
MQRFVEGRRAALQEHTEHQQEVHVVMGNEACDLDSTVSALALAYFLAKTSPTSKAAFVPVLNIPRSDFPLRPDIAVLLRQQGIPDASLVFRDEIDLAGLHRAGLLSLTLVDHHILPRADASLEEAVVEVLDHRPLEQDWALRCWVTVELVGSCATLVTERIVQGPPGVLDGLTAALLHGTILLDCVNLSPAGGKVTPRDTACVTLLESRFPELPARDVVFEALQAAKFDVSGLTTEQMLRKDLKVLSSDELALGISGIYVNLEVFLRRPGLLQDLEAFCQARGFLGLLAMTVSFNNRNEPFRQLAVYSQREAVRSAMCRALEEATTPSLHLQAFPSPWPCISAYTQGNTLASRKKVLPILRTVLGAPLGPPAAAEEDVALPPTPVNSLVDECPLAQAVPPLCPQAVFEWVSRIAAGQPPASPAPGSPPK